MASQYFTKLNPRQRVYLEQVVAGKTKEEAKRIAGYSPNSNTSRIENQHVKAKFAQLIKRYVPAHVLAQRIAEGLNAQETKFFQKDGVVTDSKNVVNYAERREYAKLAASWGGYVEQDETKQTGLNGGVQVVIEYLGQGTGKPSNKATIAAETGRIVEAVGSE